MRGHPYEPWIGLVTVRAEDGNADLAPGAEAFVNVLAPARDQGTYRSAVEAALAAIHFTIEEIEDPEPFTSPSGAMDRRRRAPPPGRRGCGNR